MRKDFSLSNEIDVERIQISHMILNSYVEMVAKF